MQRVKHFLPKQLYLRLGGNHRDRYLENGSSVRVSQSFFYVVVILCISV